MSRIRPTPLCPLRAGAPCSLCFPGATGPADCGVVYLVMSDPELRELRAATRSGPPGRPRDRTSSDEP